MTQNQASVAPEAIIEVPLEEQSARISVRNVWLMYLYASDLYKRLSSDQKARAERDAAQLPALAARILAEEVEYRLARELSVGFRERHDALTSVRGQLDLLTTERRGMLDQGLVMCRFEELTADTPTNQYVRGALSLAAQRLRTAVDDNLAARCRVLVDRFDLAGVSPLTSRSSLPPPAESGRGLVRERLMLAAAQLVIEWLLPRQEPGATLLGRVEQSETYMRKLFESGIRGFYKATLRDHDVSARRLQWAPHAQTIDPLFPSMVTDITIDRPDNSRLVIDTKFTSALAVNQYAQPKLKSQHLYQLYTYLRTQEDAPDDDAASHASGLLLYPSARGAESVDTHIQLHGHSIRAATVDLAEPADHIRARLVALAQRR